MRGDQLVEALDRLVRSVQQQSGLGSLLPGQEPQLLQPGGLGAGEVVVGQLRVRRSAARAAGSATLAPASVSSNTVASSSSRRTRRT
jgi:hypothetical protein